MARGIIHRLEHGGRHAPRGKTVTPAEGRKALETAIAATREDLSALAATADRRTADLLSRQVARLSDSHVIDPAFEAIKGGEPADTALRDAVQLRLADGDDGREDLADLRDRVLGHLTGRDVAARDTLPENAVVVGRAADPLAIPGNRLASGPGGGVLGRRPQRPSCAAGAVACVPLLIAADADLAELKDGRPAIVDAEAGRLVLSPAAGTARDYDGRIAEWDRQRRETERWARPTGGHGGRDTNPRLSEYRRSGGSWPMWIPAHCDGIGLARSEFLFPGQDGLPGEERQYRVYRALLTWAGGLPVTIRTLDAGGDKPSAGAVPEGETNPLLGLRGLPSVAGAARQFSDPAARAGPRRGPWPPEGDAPHGHRSRRVPPGPVMLAEEVAALEQGGTGAARPELGMMVETPAAALDIAEFDADFFAIGTNDLVQFVLAAGRDCTGVAALLDPLNPAVLELVARVCARGEALGREVSLCGEAASRPDCIPTLLQAGVRALSVPPGALGQVKKTISHVDLRS